MYTQLEPIRPTPAPPPLFNRRHGERSSRWIEPADGGCLQQHDHGGSFVVTLSSPYFNAKQDITITPAFTNGAVDLGGTVKAI